MAQAVFEDHPLESYLRQTGEDSMPGAIPGLLPENADYDDSDDDGVPEATMQDLLDLLPDPLVQLIQALLSEFSMSHTIMGQDRELSERFKYDIISSSLLAASISPPTSAHDRSFSTDMPHIPGSPPDAQSDDDVLHSSSSPVPLSVVVLSICTLLSILSGFIVLALLSGSSVYYLHMHAHNPGRSTDGIRPTLNTLNELIAASNLWESTVHEVHALIEDEESSIYHGSPTTSSSPSSALRVALLSALQTTQSQCDNVRHLLSALTSPAALSQLAEMYAPPSPVRPALELLADPARPVTMPVRQRVLSAPTDKRATWSGNGGLSYSAIASAGSPSRHALRRREKRRSDLSALLEASGPTSSSAPVTPDMKSVQEEDEDDVQEITIDAGFGSTFGSSALDLRKRRRISGMEALGFPSPASAPAIDRLSSPPPHPTLRHSRSYGHTARASSVAGSATSPATSTSARFTSVQTSRHPLSLTAINNALSGAISAKRYAAAHLLALRFEEEEDEQYWGDVRSIMSLLASSLAEATARLTSTLEKDERTRMNAQIPTPIHSPRVSLSLSDAVPRRRVSRPQTPLTSSFGSGSSSHRQRDSLSFAPMPSQFSRFATHVDAVSTALSDARENLESCVAALRDDDRSEAHERSDSLSSVTSHPAVQAYERLRRELGLALRECERGRERLLDLVSPPPPVHSDEEDEAIGDGDEEVPALASDDSDRADSLRHALPHSPITGSPTRGDAVLVHSGPPPPSDVPAALEALLVPTGIEQVFEAEPDALVALGRERSKISREERIRLAKARREQEKEGRLEQEKWGPGVDVVDELRDVIWKVGERRRKMMEMHAAPEEDEGEDAVEGVEPMCEDVPVPRGFEEGDEALIRL
ncbi:unnamed protein product [Peniophora sp. CBMAI 1063]|nr:unnamed protein product [Peniophora sp. CBMAI 1063]